MMDRRRFMAAGCALGLGSVIAPAGAERRPVRIGLTAVILDQRLNILRQWQQWLRRRLGRPVHFIQRRRYREITDLLLDDDIEAAWICGYPYVRHQARLRLAAIPSYAGGGWYHSLIIVHAEDHAAGGLEDMAGRRFVFSDPDSNSGFLYPRYRLKQMKRDPESFFVRTFFAWGHHNSVEAVAVRLADAGAVDSYVWDRLTHYEPELAGATRIIERSPRFGFPPIVTRRDGDPALHRELTGALLAMGDDEEGRHILSAMGLDGFLPGEERYFEGIRRMALELG